MNGLILAKKVAKTHVFRGFFGKKREAVLRGVDLQIGIGEWVVLAGKSGCGKTTLARILTHLGPAQISLGLRLVEYE